MNDSSFGGRILFLDRSDINTDEIIPAKYLTELTKKALRPHLLEDLKLAGFVQNTSIQNRGAVVTRKNFGCGSSREHAPWALQQNGIRLVVAESFARIFRQNMFNCGMLALELEAADIDKIFSLRSDESEVEVAVDLPGRTLAFSAGPVTSDAAEPGAASSRTGAPNAVLKLIFDLSSYQARLVEAGGWVELANALY